MYLQSKKSVKHMPQSPLIGHFKEKPTFRGWMSLYFIHPWFGDFPSTSFGRHVPVILCNIDKKLFPASLVPVSSVPICRTIHPWPLDHIGQNISPNFLGTHAALWLQIVNQTPMWKFLLIYVQLEMHRVLLTLFGWGRLVKRGWGSFQAETNRGGI
jgi:hypothetical protein